MYSTLILLYLFSLARATPTFPRARSYTPDELPNTLLTERADLDDPCKNLDQEPNGISRYDCKKKFLLQPDGSCKVPVTAFANDCQAYCEVRRRAFLGPEVIIQGVQSSANIFPPGTTAQLSEGIEFSIETSLGFSIGASAGLNPVFSAGVSFTYTVSTTTTKSVAQQVEPSKDYASRWVAFPIYIETCGTVTKVDKQIQYPGRGGSVIQVCNGKNPKSQGNSSSTVPAVGPQGKPYVMYALQFLDKGSLSATNLENQSDGYRAMCEGIAKGSCVAAASPGKSVVHDDKNLPLVVS